MISNRLYNDLSDAFPERMRVPSGPFRSGDPDRDMLGDGTSMVRRSDCSLHKPRELVKVGIRVCRTGRKAAIFRCSRAESYSHTDFPDDRMLGAPNTDAEEHTDAGAVRCLPIHGRRVAERSSILR